MAQLTAEVERLILAAIRAGGYRASAAVSAGVSPRQFAAWLNKGRGQKRGRFHRFAAALDQAEAQVRVRAEIDVRDQDVKFWLRYGPAKEQWVAGGKRRNKADREHSAGAFFRLLAGAAELLQPFPEARQVLANGFDTEARK